MYFEELSKYLSFMELSHPFKWMFDALKTVINYRHVCFQLLFIPADWNPAILDDAKSRYHHICLKKKQE